MFSNEMSSSVSQWFVLGYNWSKTIGILLLSTETEMIFN